jgi:hypothetical protein
MVRLILSGGTGGDDAAARMNVRREARCAFSAVAWAATRKSLSLRRELQADAWQSALNTRGIDAKKENATGAAFPLPSR